MALATQSINLDLRPHYNRQNINIVYCSQYDSELRNVVANIASEGTAVDVSTYTIYVEGTKPDKKGFSYELTAIGGTVSNNVVTFPLQLQMTAVAGITYAELVFYSGDQRIGSSNFILAVEKAGLADDVDVSETDIPAYVDGAQQAAAAAEQAKDTAVEAAETAQQVKDSIPADYTELSDSVLDLKNAFGDVAEYVQPVNRFNVNSQLIKHGYIIRYSGDYQALNGSNVTHPIPIVVGNTYSFNFSGTYFGDAGNRLVRYCKADGTVVDYGQDADIVTVDGVKYGKFVARDKGDDAHYVCVNVSNYWLPMFQFVEGETIPSTYSEWFEPYYTIKENALGAVRPLYGKKAAFTGDSICEGAGYAGGYPKIIGEKNNMIVSNTGWSGATLASGTTTEGGANRGWICTLVPNMPTDYDYYIVEGGVNDAALSNNVPIGTITTGYNDTLDTTTLCGAMESICKTLQTTFKGKKYGFIIPHNCYPLNSKWNNECRPAMKECLKKWGIPYLDLSDECAQLYNLSDLRVYTKDGDGWHPTLDGYELYYVPKIEAWMGTL